MQGQWSILVVIGRVLLYDGNIMNRHKKWTAQPEPGISGQDMRTRPEDKSYTVSIPRHYQAFASE